MCVRNFRATIHTSVLVAMALLFVSVSGVTRAASGNSLADGEALFEAEKYDEAKAVFKQLVKQESKNSRAAYYLGKIAYIEDESDDSIDWFKKAVALDPSSEHYVWLGQAYVQKLGKSNLLKQKGLAGKVKDCFIKAVKADPNNPDARAALAQFYMEAPGFAGGSKDKSLEQINILKELDAKEGASVAAQLYAKQKKYDLAEEEFLSLRDGTKEDAWVYYRIGFMHQTAKRYDEAFTSFETSIETDPDFGAGLYQIGRTGIFSRENLDRAAECLNRYLELTPGEDAPSWADAHWRLGMLFEIRDELDLAMAEYRLAIELEPDHKQAKKALKKLKRR